ncbi:MAG: Ornithine carbamoyltransferase [uncultured Thermomicrobiales bacterium]|jgi:ornithine carbamoyltransferase|uniref:Ornithine carbamoyltransferase n=1 Tax=uncultured Thermomicrobiales bacterium TaxID=1645740 RepID=A0A6J4UK03_9BACT|nr:MAG: Ornithine carbamoyltransferase [uncultured Thermomicrobiales bacterium]
MTAVVSLKGRSFIADDDFSTAELLRVLDRATALKDDRRRGLLHDEILRGKTVALIFEKVSLRTRVSFEAGVAQLGGHALFLSTRDLQLGRGETIEDTSRVLARYVDAVMARVMHHETLEGLLVGGLPTINGLSDLLHPCQALCDMLTVREKLGGWQGRTLAFVGGANNMCHSLMLSGALLGLNVRVVCPPTRMPNADILARAERHAAANDATVEVIHDTYLGVRGADVVYTDVWRNMGDPDTMPVDDLEPYRVTDGLMDATHPDAVFMHCLPVLRGQEVTAEVVDGPQSIVFDQTENRLHVQKALLVEMLAG